MLAKSKYFLIFSIFLFVANFFILANNNFTQDKTLQGIGGVIAVVSAISILISFILVIIGLIKNKAQEPKKLPVPAKNKGKKLIGLFILSWLFVIFPLAAMTRLEIWSKVFESPAGSLVSRIFFIVLITIGTFIPAILLSPLIIYIIPLFILAIYFLFSGSWHKRLDIVLIIIILILIILQIDKGLISGFDGNSLFAK
jgi:hypothetical protein